MLTDDHDYSSSIISRSSIFVDFHSPRCRCRVGMHCVAWTAGCGRCLATRYQHPQLSVVVSPIDLNNDNYYYYKICRSNQRARNDHSRLIPASDGFYIQGWRLIGERDSGGSSPQIFSWRGQRCFHPPMFRKCHCKLSQWKRLRRRETEDTTPVTDTQAYFIGLLIYMQAHTMIVSR